MPSDLLAPAEAATLLGVSVATLQRWSSTGRLTAVKTAGGHRRFQRGDVMALRGRRATGTEDAGAPSLASRLLAARNVQGVLAVLLEKRSNAGSWASITATLLVAVADIRRAVQDGTLPRVDARLALERVTRACSAWTDTAPRGPASPGALLVCAEGEDHVLPLAVLEPVLVESGLETLWLGRRVAASAVARAVGRMGVDVVVVHASATCTLQGSALLPQLRTLGHACRVHGAILLAWGRAAWPELEGMRCVEDGPSAARAARTVTARRSVVVPV